MTASKEPQKNKRDLFGITGIIVGTLLIALIGFCSYKAYRAYRDFPEYAKREVVYEQYKELLDSIDRCAEESDSIMAFAAALEKIEQPPSLLYLGLEMKEDAKKSPFGTDGKATIIKNYDWSFRTTTIFWGAGHGTLDDKKIIVIEYDIDMFEVDKCLIYLEK